ncbi:MAG TPA: hypothetical protein VN228_07880 [Pyrinomonadaceae bacterium]|nr:hypothetical protein [Pyrinomonadaceae bacterium]
MRKTLFSVLPLVVLFTPVFARLWGAPASPGHPARATTVEASALLPEQSALGRVQSRIREARRLLEAQPAPEVTDAVMLAVSDAAGPGVQLVELPKELFLSKGAEAVVRTALGVPLKLRIERPNYVNTAVSVTDMAGRALEPLIVRYPVEKGGRLSEIAFYTSAHPALGSPEMVRAGRSYVRRGLDEAAFELSRLGKPVEPGVLEAAERLCLVEHVDHKRFKTEDHASIFNEVYTLYALNSGHTYRYSVSSAGAGGMVQMIPPTYKVIREQHPEVGLHEDFVEGMRDHDNALKAMLLYMQDTWNILRKKEQVQAALASGIATQPDLLAAGYNSNPLRLPKYIERGGANWRHLIPEETKMYLRIYASVEQHVDFKKR